MRPVLVFIAGGVAAMAAVALVGLAVIETGAFDARASTPHDPLTAWATHTTMIHSVEHGAASVRPPARFGGDEVREGFRLYDRDCVGCHGAPGLARDGWANGLNPSPPYLVDAPRHWTRAQLYWVVRNGVKMTAMPAWSTVHTDPELWDLVAFLEAQPYLSSAQYQRMRLAEQTAARPPIAPERPGEAAGSSRRNR
jgi:mono/diheme cytochrome c family protein